MNAQLDAEQAAAQVLMTTRACVQALYPDFSAEISLDANLTHDLGLDSLGRVELFARLEDAFQVSLPESALSAAKTPRDLLKVILTANQQITPHKVTQLQVTLPVSAVTASLTQTHTLTDVLHWHVQQHPRQTHLTLIEGDGSERAICYGELLTQAQSAAQGLRALGVIPGQPVAIMLPTCVEYFYAFFAILLAGGIAVPLYPPASLHQMQDYMTRQAGILANAQCRVLVTVKQAKPLAQLLQADVKSLVHVKTLNDLQSEVAQRGWPHRTGSDTALLQYTSGSTGQPKGVVLSHAMLLANIRAMGEGIGVQDDDVFVSWLPLYHDMGLIGAWLGSLYYGVPFVVMSPLTFLIHPEKWLWAIHHYRATISAAPNFAYALCTRKITDAQIKDLDLSHWRLAFNGAEPVSAQVIAAFTQRFVAQGFAATTMAPVYGLAEASVGLAFTTPGQGPRIDNIERIAFMQTGQAVPAHEADTQALQFVGCGQALPGYAMRIVDDTGQVLGDRQQGHLQFQGPSCTTGYYRNVPATEKLFQGAWLASGDYAYMVEGQVYLTGRSKEMIIRAGRNIYPYALEEAIGALPAIRAGRVAVFGSRDSVSGTESLIVVAEAARAEKLDKPALKQQIIQAAITLLDSAPDDIVIVAAGTLLKTSSGKMRRALIRAQYEQGTLAKAPKAAWRQWLSLTASVLPGIAQRLLRKIAQVIYGIYAWLCLAALSVPAFVAALALPYQVRMHAIRGLARSFIFLSGAHLSVPKKSQWPTPCIFAANHASYLDAIILTAALPKPLRFVAKSELARNPLLRFFLKRIGTLFVERFDLSQSTQAIREITARTGATTCLVFFPEGTLQRAPGLMPFHMGAFVTACQQALPIIPVNIQGTRLVLPDGSWLAKHGAISVQTAAAIKPTGQDWGAAIALRQLVREAILAMGDEADLS